MPSGAGLWTQSANGKPAEYYTHAGSPDQTLQIRGTLVGADASAVYAEGQVATASGGTQLALLRYPIDGSSSTRLALPPKVGAAPQLYSLDPPPTVTARRFREDLGDSRATARGPRSCCSGCRCPDG